MSYLLPLLLPIDLYVFVRIMPSVVVLVSSFSQSSRSRQQELIPYLRSVPLVGSFCSKTLEVQYLPLNRARH